MNEIITIKIKNQFSNIIALGILLTISGIIMLVQGFLVGIAMIFLGVFILTLRKGIKLDPNKNMIKFYREILFVESGSWKELKSIQYLALVRVNLKQQMNAITIPGTYTDSRVKLNIIFEDKKILPILTEKRENILPTAQKIARSFNIDIYDNSEGKKVWIKN